MIETAMTDTKVRPPIFILRCKGPCWKLDCQCAEFDGKEVQILPPYHEGCTCWVEGKEEKIAAKIEWAIRICNVEDKEEDEP